MPANEEMMGRLRAISIDRSGSVVTIECGTDEMAESLADSVRLQLRGLMLAMEMENL